MMDRDTDQDWSAIAEEHPFFGVLANEKYLGKQLTPDTLGEFYGSGQSDIGFVAGIANNMFGVQLENVDRALDFGCGVGRLTQAMAAYASTVVGVDVAPKMLEAAASFAGRPNIAYGTDVPPGPYGWINSLIVFQHIPPPRGYKLLAQLLEKAAPQSFISIQFPFYRDRRFFDQTTQLLEVFHADGECIRILGEREHGRGAMLMYDYDLTRLFSIFVRAGFGNLHLTHTDHGGVHGAWIFGAK